MVLINMIDILSKNYPVQIGVNGSLVGVFEHADEIPYKYLNLCVECIYPGIIENKLKRVDGVTGIEPLAPRAVMRLDLLTFDKLEAKENE